MWWEATGINPSSIKAVSEMRQGGETEGEALSKMPYKSPLSGAAGISKLSCKVVWL